MFFVFEKRKEKNLVENIFLNHEKKYARFLIGNFYI